MKTYPSIPSLVQAQLSSAVYDKRLANTTFNSGNDIYAFDKVDGSNIRAEWNKKKGFYKFGSRTRLLGEDQPIISKAQSLILQQEDIVAKICQKNRWESIILFYEFAGPNSSFGNHIETDDHKVWLIDANPYKHGILPPKEFIDIFAGLNCAPLLYHGNCDQAFVDSVRTGTLEGIGSEGVVCKAKGKGNTILMFKIKRDDWYAKLKTHCNGNEALFEKLK